LRKLLTCLNGLSLKLPRIIGALALFFMFSSQAFSSDESLLPLGEKTESQHSGSRAKAKLVEAGAYLPPPPQADAAYLNQFLDVSPARSDRKANQSSLTRAQVVNLYNTLYVPGNSASMGWTGAVPPTCTPGAVSAAYRQATLDRVNFFRQVSGLPTIAFFSASATSALNAQSSALMQGANSWAPPVNPHAPPTNWKCYTSGAALAAGSSNLSKGSAGPQAINDYMDDFGSFNTSVGHRRWLLYPPMANSFSGDVPSAGTSPNNITSANNFIAFGSGVNGTRPSMPNGVAWPPGGFVPYQALPNASNRWSFHWPGANFLAATVSVTKNGQPVSILAYDARDGNGYGDAAIVFRPNNIAANGTHVSYTNPGPLDQDYVVTVSGMTGGGVPSSVTYTVTVIDPSAPSSYAINGSGPANTNLCLSTAPGARSGASCPASIDGSGNYSCNVPNGWRGAIHLQAGNTKRVHAKQFAAAVASTQSNQNFQVFDADVATSNFDFVCNMDIDNNGLYEASVDGVMMLRKLLGTTGNDQAIQTSGTCAQRTSVDDKAAFLAPQNYDLGGGALATREGLALIRRMLGVPGADAVAETELLWPSLQSELSIKCGALF
jgi:hypothetical protein